MCKKAKKVRRRDPVWVGLCIKTWVLTSVASGLADTCVCETCTGNVQTGADKKILANWKEGPKIQWQTWRMWQIYWWIPGGLTVNVHYDATSIRIKWNACKLFWQSSKFRIVLLGARMVSVYIHRMSDFLLFNPAYLTVPGALTAVGLFYTINKYKSAVLRRWRLHGSSVHCICFFRWVCIAASTSSGC